LVPLQLIAADTILVNPLELHGRGRMMKSFEKLLEDCVAAHGHLCAGQVIGVRMAMLGCRLVGIDEPQAAQWRKKLIVFVEIDRCATDAIGTVTGCRMGKRTLKFRDFGINAGTFLNLETGQAYRIVSTEESRQMVANYAPEETDHSRQQLQGYKRMPDNELFRIERVCIDLPPWEMPGRPSRHAACQRCGQVVRDGREIYRGREVLCRHCAGESYFQAWILDPSGLPYCHKETAT
jgi:formylmethanofuran dehydrogenase subunit E